MTKLLKKNYLWVAFGTLYKNALTNLRRAYVWTCIDSINAMLMLAVFSIIGTGQSDVYQTNRLFVIGVGLWVMAAITRSYFGVAHNLMFYKLERVLENYMMSPLPSWLWLGSVLVEEMQSAFLSSLPVLILLFFLGIPLPSLSALLLGLLLLMLVMIFLGCMGFFMMLNAKRWNDISKWDNTIIFPLFMLSGSFFDATALPEKYRFLMEWNPFYQLQYTIRQLWFLDSNPIPYSYIIWSILAVISFAITWLALRRGYGLKS